LRKALLVSLKAVLVSLKAVLIPGKNARVAIFATLVFLMGWVVPLWGQNDGGVGGVQSLGYSSSYSKSSSHILIGEATDRTIWTLGAEYTRLLHLGPHYRLDYEGSVMPLFEETDPTLTGTVFTFGGQNFYSAQQPVRLVALTHAPVGTVLTPGGTYTPIYATFGRQDTYAAAFTPLGARISALPRRRVQPGFALDLGFVLSARDIPIDDADQFNFMFSFGPGVQFYTSPQASLRVEYLYRHVSNGSLGDVNPGIDQGVFRVTISRRW
jgi:opacity protein-like surface antigen